VGEEGEALAAALALVEALEGLELGLAAVALVLAPLALALAVLAAAAECPSLCSQPLPTS